MINTSYLEGLPKNTWKGDIDMTEEKKDDATFSTLVEKLNKKWEHTYQPIQPQPDEAESPEEEFILKLFFD